MKVRAHPRAWLQRLAVFTGLWWLLTEDIAASWMMGVIVVAAASWLSLVLAGGSAQSPGWRISAIGLLRFIPYFAYQSLRGGLDVARRALRPDLPINPGFIEYRLQLLSNATARLFFMNTVSLLPGSLSVEFNGGVGVVHALNKESLSIDELRACEQRVAALFVVVNGVKEGAA